MNNTINKIVFFLSVLIIISIATYAIIHIINYDTQEENTKKHRITPAISSVPEKIPVFIGQEYSEWTKKSSASKKPLFIWFATCNSGKCKTCINFYDTLPFYENEINTSFVLLRLLKQRTLNIPSPFKSLSKHAIIIYAPLTKIIRFFSPNIPLKLLKYISQTYTQVKNMNLNTLLSKNLNVEKLDEFFKSVSHNQKVYMHQVQKVIKEKNNNEDVFLYLLYHLWKNDAKLKKFTIKCLSFIPSQDTITQIILSLYDNDMDIKKESMNTSARLGDDIFVEHIIQNAKDYPALKLNAIIALGYINSPKSVKFLESFLDSKDYEEVRQALFSLAYQDKGVNVDKIIKLTYSDMMIKIAAMQTLRDIASPKSIPRAKELLFSEEETFAIRHYASHILDRVSNEEARKILEEGLFKIKDGKVRSCCAESLGIMNSTKSENLLIKAFKTDIDKYVRFWSAMALGRIHSTKAVPILEEKLKDKNEQEFVKLGIQMGLVFLKKDIDKSAIYNAIKKSEMKTTNDIMLKTYFIRYLGYLKDESAIPVLLDVMNPADRNLCIEILNAIMNITGEIIDYPFDDSEEEWFLLKQELLKKFPQKIK